MEHATLLVVLGKSAQPADLEGLANAARSRDLHLRVLILGAMPPIPVYVYGMGAYGAYTLPGTWQGEVDTQNAALEGTRAALSDYLAEQNASADVRVLGGAVVDLSDAVVREALTCDLVLFGDDLRHKPDLFADALHATLFRAPAAVLLNAVKTAEAVLAPKSVFVAWKPGPAPSRAIRAALPILRAAKGVTIAAFDPVMTDASEDQVPGADVAAWLGHHGCTVKVVQYPSGGEDIGTALHKRAVENGADLLVMGAYGHSRLREAVFGGTTRSLVKQTDQAVLLCH